uniref:Uncharacterized protein n=1 Tax=Cricetulus griseus TaxID=10029 RepID=A0A8C2MPJ8_CRIGR
RTCSGLWSRQRQRRRRPGRERVLEPREKTPPRREGQSRWPPGTQPRAPPGAEPTAGHTEPGEARRLERKDPERAQGCPS